MFGKDDYNDEFNNNDNYNNNEDYNSDDRYNDTSRYDYNYNYNYSYGDNSQDNNKDNTQSTDDSSSKYTYDYFRNSKKNSYNYGYKRKKSKKHVMKVGTLTFALILIYIGVVLVLTVLGQKSDMLTMLKFSPALLIVFGVEVLISLVFRDKAQFKYDGLAIIMSLLIGFGGLGVTAAFEYSEEYTLTQNSIDTVREELQSEIEAMLSSNNTISHISVYTDAMYSDNVQNLDEQAMKDSTKYVSVSLVKEYSKDDESKLEFAKNAQEIVKLLEDGGLTNYEVSIYSYYDEDYENSLNINIDNDFKKTMSAEDLVKFIY